MDGYEKTLRVLREIRDAIGTSTELNLPQICVVGSQTSGKSSLLNCLTGVEFPTAAGICTKAPIVVSCKKNTAAKSDQFRIFKNGVYEPVDAVSLADAILSLQKEYLSIPATAIETVTADYAEESTDTSSSAFGGDTSSPQASNNTMVTDREVSITVEGPTQMDIIVVDLPGLITAGPGQEETKNLVLKYTRPAETLILLVSEAQMDEQNVPATDIAREVDPHGERTLRILTKFDALDAHDELVRSEAVELVQSGVRGPEGGFPYAESSAERRRLEGNLSLLPHAVVCRMKFQREDDAKVEGMEYQAGAENEVLSKAGVPDERAGIAKLKDRLPPMFSERVAAEIPRLEQQARNLRDRAAQQLDLVGRDAQDENSLIIAAQRKLQDTSGEFEKAVSDAHETLTEKIDATRTKITEEWVGLHFHPNNLKPPLFQGEPAFNKCLSEIVEWWRPLVDEYMAAIGNICQRIFDAPNLGGGVVAQEKATSDVSSTISASGFQADQLPRVLQMVLENEWRSFVDEEMMPNFWKKLEQSLNREAIFATVNHYLESKYAAEIFLPEELLENFINSLSPSDMFNKDYRLVSVDGGQGQTAELQMQQMVSGNDRFADQIISAKKANTSSTFSKNSPSVKPEVKLSKDDAALVLGDFASANPGRAVPQVKQNWRGVVQQIDGDGDAQIKFAEHQGHLWVYKSDFDKLQKQHSGCTAIPFRFIPPEIPFMAAIVDELDKKKLLHPFDEVRKNLKDKWVAERSKWVEEFGSRTLHEQQRLRVYAEVKAVWGVEKKTFTDMVLKDTVFEIIRKREKWINQDLLLNKVIRAKAVEDVERKKIRADAQKTEKNMQLVIDKLHSGI